jgi:hypothetical protein
MSDQLWTYGIELQTVPKYILSTSQHVSFYSPILNNKSCCILTQMHRSVQSKWVVIEDSHILRYIGAIRSIFFPKIGTLLLDEDQRTNTIKTHVQKRLDYMLKTYRLLCTQQQRRVRSPNRYSVKQTRKKQVHTFGLPYLHHSEVGEHEKTNLI